MSAHKAKSHKKVTKHAHEEHADNLLKFAHPNKEKNQKNVRRTLTHVALPVALIMATATFAIGAEVVRKQTASGDAPAVPANSVCRTFSDTSGGLSAQDSRIGMALDDAEFPNKITLNTSGYARNYVYAKDGNDFTYNESNVKNNVLTSHGVSFIYAKICIVNPGIAMPPFNSRNALVDQQYRDFLGRKATTAELTYWAGKNPATNKPYTAREIVDYFVEQDAVKRGPLVRLYKAYYKRWPDAGGYDYWVRKMKGGATLSSVSDYFAKSSEFQRNYGSLSNDDFVKLVYTNVLGRVGDQQGYNYWLKKLNDKKITRGGLMIQFSESSEFKRKYGLDCDLVGVSLRMYRRPATATELAQWNPDETAESLAMPIIFESSEYANRVVK
jgi:hypothetical protein